jgi:hypothetical protein
MIAQAAAFLALLLVAGGCTNVAQMHSKYLAGDQAQLDRLIEVAGRPDYPYATRRQAARVLGQIGDPRAVPALLGVLEEYDQRTTLKEEAMKALGAIGDRSAAEPIGRLLDRSLSEPMSELRLAALASLGALGGPKAAGILVNALRYYDLLILQKEQGPRRGVFTGEEHLFLQSPDSLRARRGDGPGLGMFPDASVPYSMFGPDAGSPLVEVYDSVPDERNRAHALVVRVGTEALPVIEEFLATQESTVSLQNELRALVAEIRGPAPNEPRVVPAEPPRTQ